MRFFSCVTDDHNLWLVGLAAALCSLGSLITMRLFQRLRHAERGARAAWTFMAAIATGATIWCTHFVAMIAYEPGAAVTYEPVLTGASLAVAIGYPDLVAVANTTMNQTGQAIEAIAILMAVYLSISLLISLFMNWYNNRVRLVER